MALTDKFRQEEEEPNQGIDMSPLLDVVFILLIFFIVSTVFVRETGVDVDKPESVSASQLEPESILIAVTSDGQVVYDGADVGVSGLRSVIEHLQSERQRPVILQVDRSVPADLLVAVIDQAKIAGTESVSIATEAH